MLVIDPSSPDIVYAGTETGGVLKTTDAGIHWTQKNSGLAPTDVWAFAIHPQDSSVLFAGTWGGGLFRSTNGGETWSPANEGLEGTILRSVVFHPSNPQVVYAATERATVTEEAGIFKSTNGGSSWQSSNSGITEAWIRTIVIDPLAPSTLYAAGQGGVSKSMDGGGHWEDMGRPSWDFSSVWSLAIDPTAPGRVLAGSDVQSPDAMISISQDGGASWGPFGFGLPGGVGYAMTYLPGNPNLVLAGTLVEVGLSTSFRATAMPLLCTSLPTFAWDFGDGIASIEQNPNHAYAAPGIYSWSLTAMADGVSCRQAGAAIAAVDPPCAITCTAAVATTTSAGSPTAFSSTAATFTTCSGPPSFSWDFGDGATSNEQNPSHTYAVNGIYHWVFTASVDGLVCSQEGTVSTLPSDSLPYVLLGNETCLPGGSVRVPVTLEQGRGGIVALAGDVSFEDALLTPLEVEPSASLTSLHFQTSWTLLRPGFSDSPS